MFLNRKRDDYIKLVGLFIILTAIFLNHVFNIHFFIFYVFLKLVQPPKHKVLKVLKVCVIRVQVYRPCPNTSAFIYDNYSHYSF